MASLDSPAIGTGYRVRAEDAVDPALFLLSPAFSVSLGPGLLAELDELEDEKKVTETLAEGVSVLADDLEEDIAA